MSFVSVKRMIGKNEIIIETGKMAKLADGAVLVKSGKNAVLVTACMSKECPEGIDFFPLTVHYQEKTYAAGKFPGGFIKREGRPSEHEILISRLIDRPIRPLFPEGFYNEVQVIATTLSADQVHSTDILGMIGASAALAISPIPFQEPAAGVRVCYLNGEFIINPSLLEVENSQLDIVAAGSRGGITMVEGGASEVDRSILLEALEIAQKYINEEISLIEELVAQVKPEKIAVPAITPKIPEETRKAMREFGLPLFREKSVNASKKQRSADMSAAYQAVLDHVGIGKDSELLKEAKAFLENLEVEVIRTRILEEDIRPDGRKCTEIRPISIELDLLDNVHGSALFTRGQTQSLGIVTLGSSGDAQKIENLEQNEPKRFMLHYNFPPFCTGEVKKNLGMSRREIGHGHLAERSVEAVIPDEKSFPYTIRMVSEVLESNGSSSMATVCSSSLALMATGVPIRKQVAGIAMGLIWNKEQGKYKILSDIQGLEDHFGDMDFKVAGTKDGVTGFQMDVKTIGLTAQMMAEAVAQAWEGKAFILSKMDAAIEAPRTSLSKNAPKIKTIKIPEGDIGAVIGSGGRVIKKIMAETEVGIDISDDGSIMLTGKDEDKITQTIYIIDHIVNGFKKGDVMEGTVARIEDYGVFVEMIPGVQGLVHKSNFKERRNPREFYKLGDKMNVKVMDIDEKKRVVLSEA